MFYIYILKNKINGKIYVGETGNPKRRYKDHIKTATSKGSFAKVKRQLIHRAIAKYGESNFEFSIIDQFATEQEAFIAEIKYIKKFKSKNRKFGYNLTIGGDGVGGLNKKITNTQAISLVKEYVNNNVTLRKLSLSYNISRDSVAKIIKGEIYTNIEISDKLRKEALIKIKSKDKSKKTNPEIIASILKDSNKMTNREIADKYKLGINYIRKLINATTQEIKQRCISTYDREKVIIILNDYLTGNFKAKDLAERHSLSIHSIRGILSGENIRHFNIDPEILTKIKQISRVNLGAKLNEDIIKLIFEKYASGYYTLKMLCDEFKVKSLGTIEFILKRVTWSHVKIDSNYLDKVNDLLSNKYYFNRKKCKHILKQECLDIFLKDLILTKNITLSAQKIDISPAHACDILNNKYWNDVPICKDLYKKVKEHYPNFIHNVFNN